MINSKETKILVTVLVVVILVLLILVVLMYTGNIRVMLSEEEASCIQKVDEKLNQVNTFVYDENDLNKAFGKVRVTGYAKTKEVPESECHDDCDEVEKVKYVEFYITKTESRDFKEYLSAINGEDSNKIIGLGCYKNNRISYINNSVFFGDKEFELNDDMTKSIIDSTSSKPITLDLEKLELGEAKGAPACYSHMTYIKIAK